jgi:Protein of unknown function (DUF2809)
VQVVPGRRSRLHYVTRAVLTIAAGLWIHRGGLSLGAVARDVTGDALWAMMMLWWVSALAPSASILTRAGAALGICIAVECSQLLHAPWLDHVRATVVGHLVLGSGFDPRDLVSYAAGVLLGAAIDRGLSATERDADRNR